MGYTRCEKCGSFIKSGTSKFIVSNKTGELYKNAAAYQTAENEAIGGYSFYCQSCGEIELNKFEEVKQMVITTTHSIEGKEIFAYKGIVVGQVFMGVDIFRDVFSERRDIADERSKSVGAEFNKAKDLLLEELARDAAKAGGNAIVGLRIELEDVGKTSGNAFMLLGTGAAVVI